MNSAAPDQIRKRFYELQKKAQRIASTHYGEYLDHESYHEWATSVLHLIKYLSPKSGENVYYKNFYDLYRRFEQNKEFKEHFSYFESCRGIFRAFIEDYENDKDYQWDRLSQPEQGKNMTISPSQRGNLLFFLFLVMLFIGGSVISIWSRSNITFRILGPILGILSGLMAVFSLCVICYLYYKTEKTKYHISPRRLDIEECQDYFSIWRDGAEWRRFIERKSGVCRERLSGLGTIHLEFYEKGETKIFHLKHVRNAAKVYKSIRLLGQANKAEEELIEHEMRKN